MSIWIQKKRFKCPNNVGYVRQFMNRVNFTISIKMLIHCQRVILSLFKSVIAVMDLNTQNCGDILLLCSVLIYLTFSPHLFWFNCNDLISLLAGFFWDFKYSIEKMAFLLLVNKTIENIDTIFQALSIIKEHIPLFYNRNWFLNKQVCLIP